MRFDLYGLIHKAQRYHLCGLSAEMGKSDPSEEAASKKIDLALRHLIDHLRDHARNEETYIHPLFSKLGTADEAITRDHERLESELRGLERIVHEKRWDRVYAAYNRFLGAYLAHLDDEERAQAEILWPNYRDEDLAAVFGRFKAERSPAAAKADLAFMLPALSVPELAGLFRAMKASAPAAAFQEACELAERTLDAATWKQVRMESGLDM